MTTSSLQPGSTRSRPKWDEAIPPVLRPLLRAYALGYASVVAPRLLTLVLQLVTRRSRDASNTTIPKLPRESFLVSLRRILRGGLALQRFPTFCAALVGGSTLLDVLSRFQIFISILSFEIIINGRHRLSRWIATFVAACLGLKLLQSRRSERFEETNPVKSELTPGTIHHTTRYAGRTLDLSLFAVTRALDVIVGGLWARRRGRRLASGRWTRVESAISNLTDPAIFAISCSLIMWAWVYSPSSLPRAYDKWISSAAAVDTRLIEALKRFRTGEIRYQEDTGQAPLLQGMCLEYKWPLQWGDPAKAIPFPCEIVHMGCGPSCEYHALSRCYRSCKWSMAMYLPLNLLLVVRHPNAKGLKTALLSACRSSAFLGSFIMLFYYGVCLARTRVGPHLIGRNSTACNKIDDGICVGSGCFLCGWSILLEAAGRRKDMALFVAPRAMATVLPRRYAWDKQWRETVVFAASTAVVFTCALEDRKRVRGVLGNVLGTVLEA
ncbi:uncharacterized protein BCR38DRAFT_343228 [Pseudomassariella vexata]|uniref:Integral membrane protein n=1 Tax=Pseudomassariella vexata TaxID=1141098 RepID=A0A1Y2DXJ8_9PEZI|nr:uncharacterized protein BCR38DRAFT_343228 [Pseudomassariella vexata]ORY63991.1 hypothetical protein BCR38DRAFT_343228 [Pseudomassariella vexata]